MTRSHYASREASGISIDSSGKVWAGCYLSSTAVRIDPNAGQMVVTNGVTNHVGLVDMVVYLGDGDEGAFNPHQSPYNVPANPYNYSDMTGFNERVVNPSFKPFKGYWMAINDSGNPKQLWNRVSWTAPALPDGCSVEVYVRTADERTNLSLASFTAVSNNIPFSPIRGRFIEVRLGMTRDDSANQPTVSDLTLYGISSAFSGDEVLFGADADEGGDAYFWTDLVGAGVGYRWFRQYPWETN